MTPPPARLSQTLGAILPLRNLDLVLATERMLAKLPGARLIALVQAGAHVA